MSSSSSKVLPWVSTYLSYVSELFLFPGPGCQTYQEKVTDDCLNKIPSNEDVHILITKFSKRDRSTVKIDPRDAIHKERVCCHSVWRIE
jgi:hypothetical protein